MGEARSSGKTITLSLEAGKDLARRRGGTLVTAAALCAAGAVLYAPVPAVARAAAIAVLLLLSLVPEVVRRARGPRRGATRGLALVVDARGIWRSRAEGDASCVARWDEPFGVTVLANPSKTRALFAFSSPERTRLVAVRVDSAQAADAARACLERAVLVTDADLDDALGGVTSGLSGRSAGVLFDAIERRAPHAVGRIDLSDAAGAKVTLDGDVLRARDSVIELGAPLEWRSFMFHEGGPGFAAPSAGTASEAPRGAVIVYQATWARQGAVEIVLVCPIPAEASSWGIRPTDTPPPRELRVAVDRLFMIPLRKALEGAPRISRAGAPPRGRGSHAIRT